MDHIKGKLREITLVEFAIGLMWALALIPIILLAVQIGLYHYGFRPEPIVYNSKWWAGFAIVYTVFVLGNLRFAIQQWRADKTRTESQDDIASCDELGNRARSEARSS